MLTIYLDGKYCLRNKSEIDLLSPGVVDGMGAFETMRIYRGKVLFVNGHFQRMERGLKKFGLKTPCSRKSILEIIAKLQNKNGFKNSIVRCAIWKQNQKLRIAIIIRNAPLVSKAQFMKGYAAHLSSVIRNKTATSHIKSIQYRLFREAYLQAKSQGYDEAFLFNSKAHLVEGARTNIFIVRKKVLVTPAVSEGCLNGIIRQFVLNKAKRLGLACRIGTINKKQLLNADEVFITNSGLGIMPVTRIDKTRVGSRKPGPVTKAFNDEYMQHINNQLFAPL